MSALLQGRSAKRDRFRTVRPSDRRERAVEAQGYTALVAATEGYARTLAAIRHELTVDGVLHGTRV